MSSKTAYSEGNFMVVAGHLAARIELEVARKFVEAVNASLESGGETIIIEGQCDESLRAVLADWAHRAGEGGAK